MLVFNPQPEVYLFKRCISSTFILQFINVCEIRRYGLIRSMMVEHGNVSDGNKYSIRDDIENHMKPGWKEVLLLVYAIGYGGV